MGTNSTLHDNLIENGYIDCTSPKNCFARCNIGYIPDNSANKHRIFSHLNCIDQSWNELPFTKCIKFESFCNFTDQISNVLEDSNAKMVMRVLENPVTKPHIVGRIRAELKCKRENFYFSKINRPCYRLRCECYYKNGKYICKKWPVDADSLDLGRCEDVDNVAWTRTKIL